MKKISIIIPVYNGEEHILNCINSVLNQTIHHLEIIIIDDGSTDNTNKIVLNLAKSDERIKLISQENKGVSQARNKGISIATGEYLCFIDSDDIIDINYCECLYNACEENDCKMSICPIRVTNENMSLIEEKKLKSGIYNKTDALKELFKFKDFNWGPCGKMFHKSLFKEDTKFYNVKVYEDLLFVYEIIKNVEQMISIESTNYYYIYYDNMGTMYNFMRKPTTDVIIVVEKILISIKNEFPYIWDDIFYGLISVIFLYVNQIEKKDSKFRDKESKIYIKTAKKVIRKYRKEIITNEDFCPKEKIMFIVFSYSTNLYIFLQTIRKTILNR